MAAIYFSTAIAGLQTYLFRRQHNELQKNHMLGPTSLPALLAPWTQSGFVRIVEDEIRFGNGPSRKDPFNGGSRIFLCHCQHEKDVFNWLGPEMHFLLIEQAEQFTPFMIQMLRGRTRLPEALNIPAQYKHLFPRVLYTFNPGGPGHAFFKERFVRALPRGADGISEIIKQSDTEGGKLRQFIQAKLDDNPSVNPTQYRSTLRGLPPRMAKALEEGDFDQVIGAFFPEIDRTKHLIKPLRIPAHWNRFMSYDHGAAGEGDPFVCAWWAVASESIPAMTSHDQIIRIPQGSLICYRRWSGHGLPKIAASQIANRILQLEHEPISMRIAGGDIEQNRGHGTTIYEIFANHGIYFTRADMRRQHGHAAYRERLVGNGEGPLIFYYEQWADALERTMNLQHDMHDPNECTQQDDHDYECFPAETLIETSDGPKRIADLRVDEKVLTRQGFMPIETVFSVGERDVYELKMSDGKTLLGTASHPIWVEGYGFKPLASLSYGDMLWSCIKTPTEQPLEKCGLSTKAQFPRAGISTTSTKTLPTMPSRILRAFRRSNTHFCTWLNLARLEFSATNVASITKLRQLFQPVAVSAQRLARLLLGEPLELMTASRSVSLAEIRSLPTAMLRGGSVQRRVPIQANTIEPLSTAHALSVESPTLQTHHQSGAPISVVSVIAAGKRRVYNLTVSKAHEYFANGVLVSNCDRYMCMFKSWASEKPVADVKPIEETFTYPTLNELWALKDQQNRRQFR